MKKIAVALASVLVVACASSIKSGPSSQTNDKSGAVAANSNTSAPSVAAIDLSKLTAEIQNLEKQSDYFDYNKFAVKAEYQNILRKEAEFIKSHKQDFVTLQGNADERGSEGYNLDLGNKRAVAVELSLQQMGVPSTQIKVVSFGEDKPRLTCHLEKCWKENRRVDFVHQLN